LLAEDPIRHLGLPSQTGSGNLALMNRVDGLVNHRAQFSRQVSKKLAARAQFINLINLL
jgi:hypothetical protein